MRDTAAALADASVPQGLSAHPMAWTPESFHDIDGHPAYVVQLNGHHVAEVDRAVKALHGRELRGDAVSRDAFLLPTLQVVLDQACRDVHRGTGFVVVRRLDSKKYTVEENMNMFLGVASYIGDQRGMQDKKGSMIIGSYPDALRALMEPSWPIQVVDPGRLGLHPATVKAGFGLEPSVPNLTSSQLEALGVMFELATKHRLRLQAMHGDMIFINNWGLLHCRDSYCRSSKLGWDVPEPFCAPWEAAFGPNGDGCPDIAPNSKEHAIERKYPTAPAREYVPPKYMAGSAASIIDDDDAVNGEYE
ncbi:hypothetical protein B0H63DRAFT_551977 [Podospora didyma]|uniref:TauD/TfdA-like domain-containing protein n=1 Tax=Podospora didyma TaxID=330526 RepID=A0AAE0K509_9PEZI|nr:hypothetical protein B0H63DRAFT_551977 [Podospora didyma]